jgi:glyoxylase-like metal-dependent hydrolase (beta-lactamase superfamily II)
MTLHHLVFNPYEVNTYIAASDDWQCIIIDPACCSPDEQAALKRYIADAGLRPVLLINTHGHFDHVIGNAFVCRTWTSIKSNAHRNDLFLMENAYRQGEIFGFSVEQPPAPTDFLNDGDTVKIGADITLRIFHIPGHSPGSIVIYSPENKWVIVGDVLFRGSIGRSDLPGGNHDLLIDGIEKKLMSLPPETTVYPGHGHDTSIERERKLNHFLRKD